MNALRIACVSQSIAIGGGAERVSAALCNMWAAAGHRVTLVTIAGGLDDHYQLDPAVDRVRLELISTSRNRFRGLLANLRRAAALHEALRTVRPDIMVSFMEVANILTIISGRRLGVPVVACQRSDSDRRSDRPNLPWRVLRRLVYPMASAVTVQTNALYDRWRYRWPRMRLEVIPNPLPSAMPEGEHVADRSDQSRHRLIGLGRLVHVKGVDLLLAAFAPLAARFPDWDLWVWGEGGQRASLEDQVARLGLSGRVFLAGITAAPWDELRRGSLFVLPSRAEGFPNAMLEAMALGLPVVAFDCPSGPREISRDGADAVLVPCGDVDALRDALADMMTDRERRLALGQRARSVRERYSAERVDAIWRKLFCKILSQRAAKVPPNIESA